MKSPSPVQTIQTASDDPSGFLSALTRRYSELKTYEDTSRVVRVTERDGSEPTRTETDVRCRIETDGSVQVETGGSALREALGMQLPFRSGPFLGDTIDQFEIWLAPHLALRAPLGPLSVLSEQSNETLTATRASAVMLDERDMVQLDLTSGDADSPSAASRYSLYVNPESMLVERVETEHRLANGVVQSTTVDISPQHATAEAADEVPDAGDRSIGPADISKHPDAGSPTSNGSASGQDAGQNGGDDAPPALGILDLIDSGVFLSREELSREELSREESSREESGDDEVERTSEQECESTRSCGDGIDG